MLTSSHSEMQDSMNLRRGAQHRASGPSPQGSTAPCWARSTKTRTRGDATTATFSTEWPLAVLPNKGPCIGGGLGFSQVMEEIREKKNHNLKTKALSMPGSEWVSCNVLDAEIPWRRHLSKRGRMPIMCSHSCHCNESIILTLLSDPQYAIYANPSCSLFPSEPSVHQCQSWL